MGSESRQRIVEANNTSNGLLGEISVSVVASKLPMNTSRKINQFRSEENEKESEKLVHTTAVTTRASAKDVIHQAMNRMEQ